MGQTILAVDDQGNFLEYIPKEKGHTGMGRRHLAITVLLYNNQGQVLLQKRKHKIFDNIWDVTGATHPLHKEDGIDETVEEATWRCLEVEYGIKEKIPLKNLGFFNYFAPYHTAQGDFCENEHCAILVGEYNGSLNLNPQAGYEYKWMDKDEFLVDLEQNPQNYTPWALKGLDFLKTL
ncbi:MAG: NUDIX domain-containing protein [Candidatus Daviesbacteria bacterium]|nr:NUDIX domain-containing protein [Candidatus Daviesbacteria bacterium]